MKAKRKRTAMKSRAAKTAPQKRRSAFVWIELRPSAKIRINVECMHDELTFYGGDDEYLGDSGAAPWRIVRGARGVLAMSEVDTGLIWCMSSTSRKMSVVVQDFVDDVCVKKTTFPSVTFKESEYPAMVTFMSGAPIEIRL